MSLTALTLAIAALVATDPPPPSATISVVALRASTEGRATTYYDPGIEVIHEILDDLQFDTYRKFMAVTVSAPFGEVTETRLGGGFTLYVEPISKDAPDCVRMVVSLDMAPKKPGDPPVNVVKTTIQARTDKPFRMGGIKLGKDDMLIVMTLKS